MTDDRVKCDFDVGLVHGTIVPALVRMFSATKVDGEFALLKEDMEGRVRVATLSSISERDCHLAFRRVAAQAVPTLFTSMSTSAHDLIRDTAFGGGLFEEAVRHAETMQDEVRYDQYVGCWAAGEGAEQEGVWGGPWRRRLRSIKRHTQQLAVGLQGAIGEAVLPCRSLRQIATSGAEEGYQKAFLSVHTDPSQGPEFFVGPRAPRTGAYLVESSERGDKQLPGRDIVTVTGNIRPFRAALKQALSALPPRLLELVDDNVAAGLLSDINALRGSWVFDFLREAGRVHGDARGYLAGLGNVLALRYFLNRGARESFDSLPLVLSLDDLHKRTALRSISLTGPRSDDAVVMYLPRPGMGHPIIVLRVVEVKVGDFYRLRGKAVQQVRATAEAIKSRLPVGRWSEYEQCELLVLERDIAWLIHEAIERYRAFGLIRDDHAVEQNWGIRDLFRRLNRGEFEIKVETGQGMAGVIGTALVFDVGFDGTDPRIETNGGVEVIAVPGELLGRLLTESSQALASRTLPVSTAGFTEAMHVDSAAHSAGTSSMEVSIADVPTTSSQAAVAAEGLEVAQFERQDVEAVREAQEGVEAGNGTSSQRESDDLQSEGLSRVHPTRFDSYFAGFIGNHPAVDRLKRSLRFATHRGLRWLDPIGLFGPRSTGKTELARRIARALDVPVLQLSETNLRSAEDLARGLERLAQERGAPMRNERGASGSMRMLAPPTVVFVDEVHLLGRRVQDALLTAIEPNDRTLIVAGRTIDTSQVTFLMATTDPGRLSEAFRSRVTALQLAEYSVQEIADILRSHRDDRDRFPREAELLDQSALSAISIAGRLVPRQALQLLRDVAEAIALGDATSSEEGVRRYILETRTVDSHGLADRDYRYLRSLYPDLRKGAEALAVELGEDPTTIEYDIEPFLIRQGLVQRQMGGRSLSPQGQHFYEQHVRTRGNR